MIVCSVLIHEFGHLLYSVYYGNLSAEIHIELNSFRPIFITKGVGRHKTPGLYNPFLNLAGIYFQLLFASAVGFLYLITQIPVLPASILLIDLAALVAIVPTPGTDGYYFFSDLLKMENMKYEFWPLFEGIKTIAVKSQKNYYQRREEKLARLSAILGIGLFFLYLISSLLLFTGAVYQYLTGTFSDKWITGYHYFLETVLYTILLGPPIIYTYFAICRIPFAFKFLSRFLKSI
jgi:hypothetical protein